MLPGRHENRMKPRLRGWSRALVAAVVAFCAIGGSRILAQEDSLELRGTWTATAGNQTLRGSWGAEVSRANSNAARGYWTLVNDAGERVLEGTWSARKTGQRWHGSWTARIAKGQSLSGVWDADVSDAKTKTFADMLTRTIEKEVPGRGRADATAAIGGSKAQRQRRTKARVERPQGSQRN